MGPEKRAGHCSHGNGKPLKGLCRRCASVHTRLPTPALWPNPSACPVTSVDLGGKQCQAPSTRDARGRNQESLFRNNTPTTTFWGAHDSTGKLGETLALLMEGNQRRKVANGPLHGSESQWPTQVIQLTVFRSLSNQASKLSTSLLFVVALFHSSWHCLSCS